jgi:hypothetical protein
MIPGSDNPSLVQAAHTALQQALADRILKRPLHCEQCGEFWKETLHGHHDDYAKPLDVRWLCRSGHTRHHIALRKAAGMFHPGGRRKKPAELRSPS